MRPRLRRCLRRLGVALVVLALAAAAPIVWVETACRSPRAADAGGGASELRIDDPGYRRPRARSFLSYPEWYIVHAYEDFAAVVRQASESHFDYLASIGGFWSSLCGANRVVSAAGEGDLETKVMLYTIGLSFTAEIAMKGLYERTIGQLTVWLRPGPTDEDRFALRLADDYAKFLQQTPWYEYPFGTELARFWRETPFGGPGLIRKVERRIGLSLEYGVKAGYAVLLGYAAGLSPAELRIRSVVRGLDASDASDPRIAVVRDLGSGLTLIETPRYRAFTEILRGFSARGREVVEIAGNRRVLTTVLLPGGKGADLAADLPQGTEVFAFSIQSRPGWRRVGLDTSVPQLSGLIRAVESRGAVFEHVYDY